jgi:cyclopropane fatty-acyl-phospholipid synthase-like methyltransferase
MGRLIDKNPRLLVESGYDHIAEQYLASRDPSDEVLLSELEGLEAVLPEGARVLELGCGAGVPATQWLVSRKFRVTAVDVSARQLELARLCVGKANLIRADMLDLRFPPESFDAVVSFYAIIHVPREEHRALLGRIHSWLSPGGAFLATWAMSDWEGTEENWEGWGAPMWWSHFDAETNLHMLREAGFEIERADVRESGGEESMGERWLWVLARKPDAQ